MNIAILALVCFVAGLFIGLAGMAVMAMGACAELRQDLGYAVSLLRKIFYNCDTGATWRQEIEDFLREQ